MNYRYRVDAQDIILSKEEHKKFTSTGGKQIVFLRNGELAINPIFVRYIKETEQLTIDQEKNRYENLQLPEGQANKSGGEYLKNTHIAFYQEMGWEHDSPDCECKKHY